MTAFDIEMSSPFPSGFTAGLGGPNQGGHQPPKWYIQYGMDLGAPDGTDIYAAFDARVTKYQKHDSKADTNKVYGAQLFMRSHNDKMGGFYTHITDVPSGIAHGSTISRGDPLGKVFEFGGISPHLHLALVEIIGGAPDGEYTGVDLYQFFLDSANSSIVTPVTFYQDGSPPTVP